MIKETLSDANPLTYGTDKEGTMDELEDPKWELEECEVDFFDACPCQPCGCSNCDEEEDEDEGHEDEDLIPSSLWIR